MKSATRACMAYVTARAISGADASHIFDYTQSKYVAFSGDVDDRGVNVFDYERGCYCSGSLTQVYDYGNGAHIDLQIKGNSFSGYDYDSGQHFEGSVTGGSVALYDYESSTYYNYSI